MEKVAFFLDYANINRAASSQGVEIDYNHLLNYIGEGRFLIDAYCYVPLDPRNEHQLDRKINDLWSNGYLVSKKIGVIAGDTYKCNFDVEMAMDVMKIAHNVKPEIIVIGSGDVDLVPLVIELRKMGIRVEIACFKDAMSRKLSLHCSDFVSLNVYCEGVFNPEQELPGVTHVQEDEEPADLNDNQETVDEEREV